MKHIIRHIAILVLALMATIGAVAETKTVTYTCNGYTLTTDYSRTNFTATGDITGNWTIDLPRSGTTYSASWTLGDVSFKWESSSAYFHVSTHQATGGEDAVIHAGTAYPAWTFTVSSTVYYIQNVKYYNELNELKLEMDNNSKSSAMTTCNWDFGLAYAGGIHKITVTLTTERPSLDIAGATMTGIDASFDYTGSAITPTPTSVTYTPRCVKINDDKITQIGGSVTLTAGEDYTVGYSANTYVGTATITLTGMGGYGGTCSTTFAIMPRERSFGGITVTDGNSDAHLNTLAMTDATDDIVIPEDIGVGSVTYDRTFTAGSTATVTLPFSVDVSKVSGGTFYGLVGIDKHGQTGWEVVMKQVTGILQPHQPYLFRPTATTMTFDLGGQTVTLKANTQNTVTP